MKSSELLKACAALGKYDHRLSFGLGFPNGVCNKGICIVVVSVGLVFGRSLSLSSSVKFEFGLIFQEVRVFAA